MPNYKGHMWGGLFGYCLLLFFGSLYHASFLTLGEWLVCTIAGSLFPDIDTKSKGQKIFYYLLCVVMVFYVVQSDYATATYVALAGFFPLLTKHRGVLHNWWAICAVVCIVSYSLMGSYPLMADRIMFNAAFFLAGVFSHVYLDLGLRRVLGIV
jgi:hypothetical protein